MISCNVLGIMFYKEIELNLRLIGFSLAGFNRFLSSYRSILVVVLLQDLTVFVLKITTFFCIYGFGTMSPLFNVILKCHFSLSSLAYQ